MSAVCPGPGAAWRLQEFPCRQNSRSGPEDCPKCTAEGAVVYTEPQRLREEAEWIFWISSQMIKANRRDERGGC